MNQSRQVSPETVILLNQLVRMGKAAEARLDGVLGAVNLSSTRMMALCQIHRDDGQISLSQLAAQLAFVKSNATQLVDRLESDGLVRRVQSCDDRRTTFIELTEAGKQSMQAAFEALLSVEEQLRQMFTPEERAELTALVSRLCDAWPR